jgi:hypothetical protein
MDRNELIFALALATIALGLAWGIWQFFSVRRSQARHGQKPGPDEGTEEMLHHRDRGTQGRAEARTADVSRTPRAPD